MKDARQTGERAGVITVKSRNSFLHIKISSYLKKYVGTRRIWIFACGQYVCEDSNTGTEHELVEMHWCKRYDWMRHGKVVQLPSNTSYGGQALLFGYVLCLCIGALRTFTCLSTPVSNEQKQRYMFLFLPFLKTQSKNICRIKNHSDIFSLLFFCAIWVNNGYADNGNINVSFLFLLQILHGAAV